MSRRRVPIECECGARGLILQEESRSSDDRSLWARYSVQGFTGVTLVIRAEEDRPSDLLVALRPKCGQCGSEDSIAYADT